MLALHALAVTLLAGTALMGWWQFDVWRSAQSDDVAARLARPPAPLTEVLGPDDVLTGEDVGVPVAVDGRYAPADQQFLVSGRRLGGLDGFWVLSPLRVESTGSDLLVVRGWTPTGTALPPVPRGQIRETGVLQPGEEGSGVLSAGRVVPAIRIPTLVGEVERDLYGGYLLRTGAVAADPAGLRAVPVPEPEASGGAGLRNLAYAAQWWLFGAFTAFLWWRICVDRVAVHRVGATAGPVAPAGCSRPLERHRGQVTEQRRVEGS